MKCLKPDYVLKVFIDKNRTETRHRKLLAMLNTPLSISAMSQVTWPVDVVYDNGRFVGYVMPETKNNEDLNVMYSDKYICPLNEKITIAKNLCAAVNSIHEVGQVCGDLNPKNIAVDPRTGKLNTNRTAKFTLCITRGEFGFFYYTCSFNSCYAVGCRSPPNQSKPKNLD